MRNAECICERTRRERRLGFGTRSREFEEKLTRKRVISGVPRLHRDSLRSLLVFWGRGGDFYCFSTNTLPASPASSLFVSPTPTTLPLSSRSARFPHLQIGEILFLFAVIFNFL